MFCPRDVDLIMNVPIPISNVGDSMYWGREEKGFYTVKSAYRFAKGIERTERELGWTGVWYLNLPPKAKCFFWTLCSMCLPTKDLLYMKRVNCDQVCMLCGLANESVVHLFANCSFARDCWRELDAAWNLSYVDSQSWLAEMWNVLSKNMLEKVVMVCWALWENRNSLCWKNTGMPPITVVQHALAFYENWKKVTVATHESALISNTAVLDSTSWLPPPPGYLKLNIDVSMAVHHRRMGFGWVCRDETGIVVGVRMNSMMGLYSVREAEAMGAREVLSWIKLMGWERVILETDAQIVTRAVQGGLDFSPFGTIIHDIRLLLKSLPYVCFVFAKRSSNIAAHSAAYHASCNTEGGPVVFLDSSPRFLSGVV
ncbi:uncharacterized protein LOC115998901 [Ipomoea triloba]|uniref:uncharacterized protein LOC115998901 n=1 Tax=Ipomoea triloba TaxID=35885 RepID=UPI00125D9687|nr:uncharacterized protein LOC115998901 [Ipomoea triloba]